MINPQTLLILVTILGAVTTAALGWIESGNPFKPRNLAGILIRAGIGGALSSLIFQDVSDPTRWTYLTAFLIGAGLDVATERIYLIRTNA